VFDGLGLAGVINLAMLLVAAGLFVPDEVPKGDPITAAHAALATQVGGVAALAFGIALLASGLSSASVGTYAGQVVMQGFIGRRIPLVVRRTVTMLPALIVLGVGLPATASLVVSQVVLSFGIPFALVPLVLLTRKPDVMGPLANARGVTALAALASAAIIALNLALLVITFMG
jgi:manganese transport protein